jgi:predicted RNase H-like HicB family nuclease/DNA-binding XRE family transcriptional regulator
MMYHFRIHDDKDGLWAECLELDGCVTQGKNRSRLAGNMKTALNLYLDEPEGSKAVFPPPLSKSPRPDIVPVEVEPAVAFSMQLRQLRIRSHLTQQEAASRLGMKNLFSYQRLERRANPSLATLKKVKTLFPQISLDSVLGS